MDPDAHLSLRAAAHYLSIHPETLRRWASERRVQCLRIGLRGDLRFRRADLDALLADRATGARNTPPARPRKEQR